MGEANEELKKALDKKQKPKNWIERKGTVVFRYFFTKKVTENKK
jgi:hypothetical protein